MNAKNVIYIECDNCVDKCNSCKENLCEYHLDKCDDCQYKICIECYNKCNECNKINCG